MATQPAFESDLAALDRISLFAQELEGAGEQGYRFYTEVGEYQIDLMAASP